MNVTKLSITQPVNAILNSPEAQSIVEAVKQEKETKQTNWDTSKRRTQMYKQIEALIQQQGLIFKKETEEAVQYVIGLSESGKKLLNESELAIQKLQKGWDEKEGAKVSSAVPTLKKLNQDGAGLKVAMVNHQDFRAGFGSEPRAILVLGNEMFQRLHAFYLGFRAEPLKAYMLVQDKFEKLNEYEKRGEHFASMLPALKGQQGQEREIFQSLSDDKEAVEKARGDIKVGCEKVAESCKRNLEMLKTKPPKDVLPSMQENEKKLKVYRAQRNTATQISDNYAKKAGPLASKPTVKEWATAIKKLVGEIEKDIQTMIAKTGEVQKAYDKALSKK